MAIYILECSSAVYSSKHVYLHVLEYYTCTYSRR